jgi:esterase/lipase superfamily enzyme
MSCVALTSRQDFGPFEWADVDDEFEQSLILPVMMRRAIADLQNRRGLALALALAVAPGLSGCASVGLSAMSATAPSGVSARKEPTIIPIFVASTRRDNRERTAGYDTPKSNAHFTFETISVPPGHRAGQIELPSWGKPNPRDHFVLTQTSPVETEGFTSQIATHLSGRVGSNRDVLIFVHGFNTTLDEARFRLAQVTADGRFGGVPVLFTWPSTSSVLSYVSARENATISRDALTKLLTDISRTPGVGRIHVLAHSMGAWLSMEALRETAIGGQRLLDGKLGNVMLAAPDIDLSVFRQQMQRIGGGADIAVFSSTGDRALSLSSTIAGDRTRLGAIDPNNARDRAELAKLGVKVYDLSAISDGWINHGAYATAPNVVRQIGAQLTRARKEDAQTTSFIDAGVEPSRPQTTAIEAKPLDAPQAAQ